jgi:hypothetical protein
MMMKAAAIGLTAVIFASCNASEPAASASMPAPVRVAKAPPATAAPGIVTGPVAETMNAAGYTYIRIASEQGDFWAAVPETHVEKGSVVSVSVQMMTENFESSALHRKFDRLAFGTIGDGASSAGMPPPSPSAVVENVQQPVGGKAVADLWKERKALAGKDVVVRGKVVKFLPQIMGKNWIHLRDGSGSQEKKDNDITVTTMDDARVGDVVTVTGRVAVDKDLGSGYAYAVMIENAKVKP